MLVLSRKESERIVIDGNIVITVVRVAGGSVRLGIEAPPEIAIKRSELLEPATNSESVGAAQPSFPQWANTHTIPCEPALATAPTLP